MRSASSKVVGNRETIAGGKSRQMVTVSSTGACRLLHLATKNDKDALIAPNPSRVRDLYLARSESDIYHEGFMAHGS